MPRAFAAAMEAVSYRPSAFAYSMLKSAADNGAAPPAQLIPYFEQRAGDLARMVPQRPGGYEMLECRQMVAAALATLYQREGRTDAAEKWKAVADAAKQDMAAMLAAWQ